MFTFNPMKFVDSLSYLAKGMVGILIVMGLIIVTTVVLNKVSSRKKKQGDE